MSVRSLRILLSASAVLCSFIPSYADESPLEATVSVLEQWVETERQLSESRTSWEADRAAMENLMEVYKQEIEVLDTLIEEASADTSAAEQERADLLEEDEAIKKLERQVEAQIIAAEEALKTLELRLPIPLREELQPLFNSLPEDSKNSKLAIGQRIQPVVAILTQVQKFNQVVTVVEGFREFEEGRAVQTEKIYLGLGAAYFVDKADEHAGYGVISESGWEWVDDNSLIPLVREMMNIYRGTQQARYVDLPVNVN
jgi:cellobiose-specific phosphotransferase system component IIA